MWTRRSLGLVVLAVTAACGGSAAPASVPPAVTAAPSLSLEWDATTDAAEGDCLHGISDKDDESLLAVAIVPCDTPHAMEAYAVEALAPADVAYPGDEAVDEQSLQVCEDRFEAYVGVAYEDSVYEASYYTPNEAQWLSGDHTVLCVITSDPLQPLTGSVRGANR